MTGYKILTVDKLLEAIGEDGAERILSGYSCPRNSDIQDFLRHKAIQFSRQGLAKTHLVFAGYKGRTVLAGYFALANKTLFIPEKAKLGASLKKRLSRFVTKVPETKMNIITAPLIAQLGKNYAEGYDALIPGAELLQMACDAIQETQLAIGGKVAYLECEDQPGLVAFYEENGFRAFDRRKTADGSYLVQMIRYF